MIGKHLRLTIGIVLFALLLSCGGGGGGGTGPQPPPGDGFTVEISANTTSGTAPLTVSFTSTVSGGTSPYAYSWTFGDGETSTSANPTHTFTSAGSFTTRLRVTDDKGNSANSNSRTITVTASEEGDEYEPDNTFDQATAISTSSSDRTQNHTIEPAGDVDFYRFSATDGTRYHFYSTGSTDTYAQLYDADHSQVAHNDDGGSGANFRLDWTASSSGTYYIKVRGYGGGTTGSYTFHYSRESAPPDNHAPVIDGMSVPSSIPSGGSDTVSCTAHDQDGDSLTYTWDDDDAGGSF
ncbi:MAG: hypothetical protein B1H03_06575, partial [Planctomycetales bacterium 4484_113]